MQRKQLWASFLFVTLASAMSFAAGPAAVKESSGEKTPAELPNVFIIGDSISLGYTEGVKQLLKGTANVSRPPCNCAHSGNGVRNVEAWLGKTKWDVIHFNFGIWDTHCLHNGNLVSDRSKYKPEELKRRYTTEQHVENLAKILAVLKKTGAKVIWASTTPYVSYGEDTKLLIQQNNKAARELMDKEGVVVDDLHGLALPNLKTWQSGDGCHFNGVGYEQLAKQVVSSIAGVLKEGAPASPAGETAKPAAAGAASAKGKKETWILSGQSNACGKANPVSPLPADPRVEIFDPQKEAWVSAQEPLPGMRHESPGPSKGLGPWQAAALEVVGKTGGNIRLTGTGCDGRAISFWAEGQPGWTVLSDRINKAGKGADVFLWYQGESDGLANSRTYLDDLKKFVARMRAAAESPKMMVVAIQIGPLGMDKPCTYAAVREAQRRFVIEDGNALLVPAVGRKMADPYHPTRDGYIELGKEIGRALLRTRHGAKDVDWPGPVLDAAVLDSDGKTVTAHFAEVKKLSGCLAADFAVVEPDGMATVRAAAAKADAGNTVVTLTFAEAMQLPAALAYAPGNHPKATLTDEAGNRAPAVQMEIVKGKPPEDKPSAAPNGAGAASGGAVKAQEKRQE